MNQYNELGQAHGYWEEYYDDNSLLWKGNFVNGVLHGYWEQYYYDGTLFYKGNLINDKRDGYWTVDGEERFYF